MDEPTIKPVTIWAIIATVGFFGMSLIVVFAGEQARDLKVELYTTQRVELVQDSLIRGLQSRLEKANKLNGALELENVTDCQ